MKKNWKQEPLDIDFMIDSGLLFHINHTVLHVLGIAMSVKVDANGVKSWSFKDARSNPSDLTFDKATAAAGVAKLQAFMSEFGNAQINLREKKLGWGCQPISQVEDVKK